MFILNCNNKYDHNYPKFMFVYNLIMCNNCSFYYLIAKSIEFSSTYEFPNYMITTYLYSSIYKPNKKFNLSKLGTDYIINGMGLYHRSECIGEYPDNYIFVKEILFLGLIDRLDPSPLKKFKVDL